MYYTEKNSPQENSQSHPNPEEPHETHFETTEDETAYERLLQSFESLAEVANPVKFPLLFEQEQRRSGLRVTTFRRSYQAWLTQRKKGGER
jgi:hypothetical protein